MVDRCVRVVDISSLPTWTARNLLLFLFLFSFYTMQAPRTSRASLLKGRAQANAVAQQALIAHWQSIVKSLDNYLKIMKANYVSSIVPIDF